MPAGGLFSTAEDVSKFCRMILNGGELNGRRYLSVNAVRAMTSEQSMGLNGSDYGFGWGISADGMGHGGAYNNAMEISRTKGRILVFMVQQNGPWGTDQGKAIVKTLEPLADSVAASAGVAGTPIANR
jgi:CubicO group peptidase (beta-lactamase class C family)